jgi:hypothetical protein
MQRIGYIYNFLFSKKQGLLAFLNTKADFERKLRGATSSFPKQEVSISLCFNCGMEIKQPNSLGMRYAPNFSSSIFLIFILPALNSYKRHFCTSFRSEDVGFIQRKSLLGMFSLFLTQPYSAFFVMRYKTAKIFNRYIISTHVMFAGIIFAT